MKSLIRCFKNIILLFLNTLIFIISLCIPKSKKIIIMGGWFGDRFSDNSKYMFLYLNDYKKTLGLKKVIWITRNVEIKNNLLSNGYETYDKWSLLSIWYHLRAKFHIIDQSPEDINAFFSVRSKRINLWHGFPLKKIGSFMGIKQFEKKSREKQYLYKIMSRGGWADHYLLAPSEFSGKILGEAFGVQKNKVLISGYPRNQTIIGTDIKEYMTRNEQKYYSEIEKYQKDGFKIVGYFPTFRDNKETLIFGTKNENELYDFLEFCQANKIKIVGKFHFAGKNDNPLNLENHDAFLNLKPEMDIYVFIKKIDVLITDYSSVYFDFLLLNRPIIFFPYDLEYYKSADRGLIFEYDHFTPGFRLYSILELEQFLLSHLENINEKYSEEYGDECNLLKNKIFGEYKKMDVKHLFSLISKI